jgi:XTP/dITP diphosphohydrolase
MKISRILIASNNQKKKQELIQILSPLSIEILSPKDINLQIDPEETGTSFRENAWIKAKSFFDTSGIPSLADDSGICVTSLQGRPGVYSARYGDPGFNDEDRAKLLLREMQGIQDREAFYVSVICLFLGVEEPIYSEGVCRGEISLDYDSVGKEGFGYDPIFYYPPMKERFSRVSSMNKHQVSHRGIALSYMLSHLSFLTRN